MSQSSEPSRLGMDGLSCRGVWKVYQRGRRVVRALKDVTFDVVAGQMLALTGTSGSGKSTLLSLFGAVDIPTKGELTAFGLNLGNLSERDRDEFRRNHIGFLFQDLRLISHLTAIENVIVPLLFENEKPNEFLQRAARSLQRLGLDDRLDHYPRELSYGEQQRIAFARALIRKPRLLLADEPTANLDDTNATIVVEVLKELRSTGVLVVVASHDPRLIESCDRYVHLNDGSISAVKSEN